MQRVIAIGDIHGCIKTFRHMLFDILKIRDDDKLILLGDYIDRGPGSKEVMDLIIELKGSLKEVVHLLGNHDYMMMRSIFSKGDTMLWYRNRGQSTLKSLGVSRPADIPERYLDFVDSCPYYHVHGDYFFVHGGLNFELSHPLEDKYSMIWIRNDYVTEDDLAKIDGRKMIVGHTPKSRAEIMNSLKYNRIYLDGGCVYDGINSFEGYLAALELNTFDLQFCRKLD
jgi:serine/threonine protein phosphatase 1